MALMAAMDILPLMLPVSNVSDATTEHNLVLTNLPADIFFTGDESVLPDSAIGNNYLTNFNALKTLGDKLLGDLVSNLSL